MPLRPALLVLLALSFVPVFASSKPKSIPNQSIDQIVANERALGNTIRNYSPMVETYLQRMQPDNALGFVPSEDHYFLGRVQFQQNKEEFFLDKRLVERMAGSFTKFYSMSPVGFASMIFVDRTGFDRKNYNLRYMRSEFLGEIRCLLFEVSPKKERPDRFRGAVWV